MTIQQAIDQTNELKPNTYSVGTQIRWLSEIDLLIKRQIIDTHEGYETIPDLGLDANGDQVLFTGYTEDTDMTTALLAPEPFSKLYIFWLSSQIDLFNGEMTRYNNMAMMYNTALQEYASWYNRTVLPIATNIYT